jgi:hypothetical protein
MWTEAEIIHRENLVRAIPHMLLSAWQSLNPAVRMVRVETPILTPAAQLQSHIEVGFDLLGPVGKDGARGYLRPETTAGTFAALNAMYPQAENRVKQCPLCVWQVGLSFRDEAKGETMRASKLRLIQFYQMEFQLFLRRGSKADYLGAATDSLVRRFGGNIVVADELPHYSERTLDWHIADLEVAGCSFRKDWPDGDLVEIAIGLDRLVALQMSESF